MGLLFVVIFHLAAIFVLSAFTAVLCGLVATFTARSHRKRKTILAVLSPFVGFFTFYFAGIAGLVAVSQATGTDMGIGDSWYVPLKGNYQLLFVDVPEQASINNDGPDIVSDVSRIGLRGSKAYGQTRNGEFFSFDFHRDKLIGYRDANAFSRAEHFSISSLESAQDFYAARKWELAGKYELLVLVLAVLLSGTFIFGMWRVGLIKVKARYPG